MRKKEQLCLKKTGVVLAACFLATGMAAHAEAASVENLSEGKTLHLQALKKMGKGMVSPSMAGKKQAKMAEALGLDQDDGLKETRSKKDETGKIHTRYQQYFKGIPVWDGETVVHFSGDTPYEINGKVIKGIKKDLKRTTPAFSNAEALQWLKTTHAKSRKITGAQVYANEKSELMIFVDDNGVARLAYAVSFFVDTTAGGNPARPYFILDATTKKILKSWEGLTHEQLGTGPGGNPKTGSYEYGTNFPPLDVTLFYGGQKCAMVNGNVRTYDLNGGSSIPSSPFTYARVPYPYCRNDHDSINGALSPLNDAHFFGNVVYEHFKTWYHEPPLLFQLPIYVHYGVGYENAFWDGESITFGDGRNTFYPLVSLDIVAHEVAHGFTEKNSNLNYFWQSGGINESFSDMAGEAAEFYARGTNDFECGAEIYKAPGKALRYMCDPPKDGMSIDHASKYNDRLDVHYSSGVFNKAFCLLAKTNGWDVHKAFDIFVKANMYYWTSSATFVDAAKGTVSAANDLGYNVQDVVNAFEQVGVYPVPPEMKNAPVVQEAYTRHEGTSTLVLVERSMDPDYKDPAKAAYWGTGHDGSPGKIKINWGDGVLQELPRKMIDMPAIEEFRHKFSDAYLATKPASRCSPANTLI